MSDSPPQLIVRTEHLAGEMLLIDLGNTTIVSDHPEHMGGTGKGPNPGELIKGALASSAVLAIDAAITREGLPVQAVSVACSTGFHTARREEGLLPALTTLTNFELHVAIAGGLDQAGLRAVETAVLGCGVAQALAAGIRIDEHDEFRRETASHPARATTHLLQGTAANRPATDQAVIRPADKATAVKAEWIGDGRALLHWSRTVHLAETERGEGRRSHGSAPEVLLLAGLSACTSVFVARSAALEQVQAEVRVVARGNLNPVTGALAIDKALEVTGQMRPEQEATLAYFGANCAVGESLRRPQRIAVTVEQIAPENHAAPASQATALAAQLDGLDCDDGACCVPDLSAKATTEAAD